MKDDGKIKTIQGRSVKGVTDALVHQLRRMLSNKVGQFPRVMSETGLSRAIISKIHIGTSSNPTLDTIVRICESSGYTVVFRLKDSHKKENTNRRNRTPEDRAKRAKKNNW